MKTHFIDLHVHTIYSQEQSANLSIKETLDYYQNQGLRNDGMVYIRINDHNTIFGGVKAVEYFLSHRQDYPNLFVIPGIEFSANLGYAMKLEKPHYEVDPDFPHCDDKYTFVFKKGHVGAGPILENLDSFTRWKENKDLIAYSKLSKMFLDSKTHDGIYYFDDMTRAFTEKELRKSSNIGDQVISCKNILRKQLGVCIPYSELIPCTEDGLNADDILTRFFEIACKYIKDNYEPYKELSYKKINYKVRQICKDYYQEIDHEKMLIKFYCDYKELMPFDASTVLKISKKPFVTLKDKLNQVIDLVKESNIENKQGALLILKSKVKNYYTFANKNIFTDGNRKINIDELCNIVYEAGGLIDFEHPNINFRLHSKKVFNPNNKNELEYEEFAQIPTDFLKDIDFSTIRKEKRDELLELINNNKTIDIKTVIKHDHTGMVALQIIKKSLEAQNIKFNKGYIGAEVPKDLIIRPSMLTQIMLNVMDRKQFVVSFGFDKHMNNFDYNYIHLKDKNYDVLFKEDLIKDFQTFNKKFDEFGKFNNDDSQINHYGFHDDYSLHHNGTSNKIPLVKKLAYCDALLGKDIDFKSSVLIEFKVGAEKHEFDEQFEVDTVEQNLKKAKREFMYVVYKDLHEYSQKFNQTPSLNAFVKTLGKESREYVLSLDSLSPALLGKCIADNRMKLEQAYNSVKLSQETEEYTK